MVKGLNLLNSPLNLNIKNLEYVINDPATQQSDTNHPWFDIEKSGQVQKGCRAEALDTIQNLGDDWTGTNAWDKSTDWVSKAYFERAGWIVAEFGLNSYIWFVKNFGLNIGVLADTYVAPNFALNFDVQLGPTLRF